MPGPFHRAAMGVSNNEELPSRGAPHRLAPVCRVWLLTRVYVLDAVALVLEGRAISTLEILPATGLAVVLVACCGGLAEVDVAHGPEPSVVSDDEGDRADVPRRVRGDERRPVRVAAVRAARVEDGACAVMDRIHESRAVVAVEGADERVEVGRAVAGHVDRQADPRRAGRGDARVVERKLRDLAERLAGEARGLVIDARVVTGSDRDRVVEDRAIRGAGAHAAVHGAARVTVRSVRRAVAAQKLTGCVGRRSSSGAPEQDRIG